MLSPHLQRGAPFSRESRPDALISTSLPAPSVLARMTGCRGSPLTIPWLRSPKLARRDSMMTQCVDLSELLQCSNAKLLECSNQLLLALLLAIINTHDLPQYREATQTGGMNTKTVLIVCGLHQKLKERHRWGFSLSPSVSCPRAPEGLDVVHLKSRPASP